MGLFECGMSSRNAGTGWNTGAVRNSATDRLFGSQGIATLGVQGVVRRGWRRGGITWVCAPSGARGGNIGVGGHVACRGHVIRYGPVRRGLVPLRPVPEQRIPFHLSHDFTSTTVTTQMFWDSDLGKTIDACEGVTVG